MPSRYIWIKNQRYYLYDTYETWTKARKVAQYFRKKNKSRYFILKYESGFLFPEIRYALYMNRAFKIW